MRSGLLGAEEEGGAGASFVGAGRSVPLELLVVILLVVVEVVLNLGELALLITPLAHTVDYQHTSPRMAYQCASDAKMVLLLSIFMTPIDLVTCSTSLSSPSSSPSSLIDSGPPFTRSNG